MFCLRYTKFARLYAKFLSLYAFLLYLYCLHLLTYISCKLYRILSVMCVFMVCFVFHTRKLLLLSYSIKFLTCLYLSRFRDTKLLIERMCTCYCMGFKSLLNTSYEPFHSLLRLSHCLFFRLSFSST